MEFREFNPHEAKPSAGSDKMETKVRMGIELADYLKSFIKNPNNEEILKNFNQRLELANGFNPPLFPEIRAIDINSDNWKDRKRRDETLKILIKFFDNNKVRTSYFEKPPLSNESTEKAEE